MRTTALYFLRGNCALIPLLEGSHRSIVLLFVLLRPLSCCAILQNWLKNYTLDMGHDRTGKKVHALHMYPPLPPPPSPTVRKVIPSPTVSERLHTFHRPLCHQPHIPHNQNRLARPSTSVHIIIRPTAAQRECQLPIRHHLVEEQRWAGDWASCPYMQSKSNEE